MQTDEEIHIGEIVKQVMKDQGRSPSWLAKNLCCNRDNVYKIYKRSQIDTSLLFKISLLLGYNFFAVYYSEYERIKNG